MNLLLLLSEIVRALSGLLSIYIHSHGQWYSQLELEILLFVKKVGKCRDLAAQGGMIFLSGTLLGYSRSIF